MIYDHIVCFLEMVSLKSVCFPCPLCADTCYTWQRVWYCGRPSHRGWKTEDCSSSSVILSELLTCTISAGWTSWAWSSGRVKHTPFCLYFYSDMRVTMSQTLWPWSASTVFPVQPFLMYGTVREFLECLAFSLFKIVLFPPKKNQPLYRICSADGRLVLWWYLKQTVTLSDACVWFITALLQYVRAHI